MEKRRPHRSREGTPRESPREEKRREEERLREKRKGKRPQRDGDLYLFHFIGFSYLFCLLGVLVNLMK